MKKLKGIGLSGKMYSGKTTLSQRVQDEYGSKGLSFADEVKALATSLFGSKTKDRKLLQAIGQSLRQIDEDVWVNVLLRNIKYLGKVLQTQRFPHYPIYVIDDVRYPNEKARLEKEGFIVVRLDVSTKSQLDRARYRDQLNTIPNKWLTHESEISLDWTDFEYVIDSNQDLETTWAELKGLIDDVFEVKKLQKETAKTKKYDVVGL